MPFARRISCKRLPNSLSFQLTEKQELSETFKSAVSFLCTMGIRHGKNIHWNCLRMCQMRGEGSFRGIRSSRRRNEVYNLWIQDSEESEAAGCKAYSCEIERTGKVNCSVLWALFRADSCSVLCWMLEKHFLADFAQSFAAKLYCCSDDFFWRFLNSFPFHCFSADSPG